jgi:predicted PurR-regulated permease PerM
MRAEENLVLTTPTQPRPRQNDAVAAPVAPAVLPPPDIAVAVKNVALTLVGAATALVLLRYMRDVLLPFALAGLLFYALDPVVDWLQRHRVPRAIGAAFAILVLLGSLAGLAYSLQDDVVAMVNQLPQGARRLSAILQRTAASANPIQTVQEAADALRGSPVVVPSPSGAVRVQVEEPGFQASEYFWAGSMGFLSALNRGVMILFLTYFMLLLDDLFKRKLVELGPTLSRKKITVGILGDIAGQIERFFVVQVMTSLLVGVVTWLALWALGLQQAALWGLLAGVFNSIPYYGPLMVTGGLAAVAFLQFGTLAMTTLVAVVSLLITTAEGMLLTPTLMGKVAQMNAVAVFAGLLFWSWAWGLWGLLLAVPLMMMIKAICDGIEDLQPIGRFLGE